MAEIVETPEYWVLKIAPDVRAVEFIDEPEKGYKAVLGFDDTKDKHVVMEVSYSKNKFSLDDVKAKIDSVRSCGRCHTLDKEKLKVSKVKLMDSQPVEAPAPEMTPVVSTHTKPQSAKDMLASAMMDALLSNAGKFFLGTMLNDQSLIDSAMPKDPDEWDDFLVEFVEFMSGEKDLFRTPEEAKEYFENKKKKKEGKVVNTRGRRGRI